MFNRKLKKEITELRYMCHRLEWIVNNPPIFKQGQSTEHGICVYVGIECDRSITSNSLYKYYYTFIKEGEKPRNLCI